MAPPATPPTPRDFYAEASLLYPWLPPELLAIFAEAWERYAGDTALALATMRQSDAYLRHFPGNRRTDGSIRLEERDYRSTMEAYAANLANRQLNPDLFSHRFVELIEGEVSADEFDARLGLVYNQIVGRFDEMREWLAGDFGIDATDEAIYAFALNPEELGDDILNRRITNAQIGGWARFYGARQGQQMDRDRIDYLRQMGVNESQARQVYSTVGERLPQLDTFASRYDSRDRTFDLDEYESLAFLDDPNQGSRARRLIEQERSLFTGGRVARGRTGEVTGLEQR